MVIAVVTALAAPVICDPDRAERILADARIEPGRVPVTQPNLLPGLARRQSDPVVRSALDGLCEAGSALSLAPAERWEAAGRSAHSFVLTRSTTDACEVVQDAVVLTVGVESGGPLRFGIRGHLPRAVTPIDGCEGGRSIYRSESVLDGGDGPIRLVLVRDLEDDRTVAARVVVRRATDDGWREQVLLDPAPERLLDPSASGPRLSLSGADERAWIVAHADRRVDATGCAAVPGQTVWRWDGTSWQPERGRAALGLLAGRGAWRLAGEDGWFLILAQDTEGDLDLLQARARKLQRRHPEPLTLLESASFPGMNAGFVVVTPDPWPTEQEAEAQRSQLGRRTGVYVRQGWSAPDPCDQPQSR